MFSNVRNPRSAVNRRGEYERTTVKEGVTVGAVPMTQDASVENDGFTPVGVDVGTEGSGVVYVREVSSNGVGVPLPLKDTSLNKMISLLCIYPHFR